MSGFNNSVNLSLQSFNMRFFIFALLVLLSDASVAQQAELKLATGFTATVIHPGTGRNRHIAVNSIT
jgi:hypothetical protein